MTTVQDAPTRREGRIIPQGTINVVDPSPLNWLFITWNTMEEPIRTDQDGRVVYALAESSEWLDDRTLQLKLRAGVRFQNGEALRPSTSRSTSTRCRSGSPHTRPAPG